MPVEHERGREKQAEQSEPEDRRRNGDVKAKGCWIENGIPNTTRPQKSVAVSE